MANSISQIKSGMPDMPMARHNNNRDIETTFDIGTVQALQMKVMNGNSVFDCNRWASVIRIGAMPVPTFGRLKYKMYNRFVKMEDIYPAWSAFLEQKPYTGGTLTYIPQRLPFCTFGAISKWLLSFTGTPLTDDPSEQPYTYFKIFTLNQVSDSDLLHSRWSATPLSQLDLNEYVDPITGEQLDVLSKIYEDYGVFLDPGRNVFQVDDPDVQGELAPPFYAYHNDNITIENADYILDVEFESAVTQYTHFIVAFRLTRKGKALVKNLNALGWKFDPFSNRPLALPYLVGFYKCYFDLMMPSKDSTSPKTWDMTNAYKLMHYSLDNDFTNYVFMSSESPVPQYQVLLRGFFEDLAQTFYYDDSDYFSAHIISPSISPEQTPGISSYNSLSMLYGRSVSANSDVNSQPVISSSSPSSAAVTDVWSALNIRLALRLLAYTGKDTVLGGKIRESLKAHYGYDVEAHGGLSYNVANFVMDVIISDIYSTADTRDENDKGALLGSLGGKAGAFTGDAANPKPFDFKFEAPSFGMLYSFGVVVPESGFCQGVDNNLSRGATSKWEIYNPMLDALGYDLSRKDVFLGENFVCGKNSSNYPNSFGFIPRMTDTKIAVQNILNGDLARRSPRRQLLAYTLNKFISTKDFSVISHTDDPDVPGKYTEVVDFIPGAQIPVASPEINSFGRPWMMNFGRIFYLDDSFFPSWSYGYSNKFLFGLDDEFIAQNVVRADYFDHSKPTSESFESDGENGRTLSTDFSGK